MFDPTAFENMKVILEGALYDLDLRGEIVIIDRNDVLNMAKLSRCFDLSFTLANNEDQPVIAKFRLQSELKNFAAELLPDSLMKSFAGSYINLEFSLPQQQERADYDDIAEILTEIWGANRKITIRTVMDQLTGHFEKSIAAIEFTRLIREEQMEDLVEMINFMKTTLHRLQSL